MLDCIKPACKVGKLAVNALVMFDTLPAAKGDSSSIARAVFALDLIAANDVAALALRFIYSSDNSELGSVALLDPAVV